MKIKTRRTLVGAAWACVGVLGLSALTGVAVAAEQSRSAGSTMEAAASVAPSTGGAAVSGRRGLRALGSRVLHGELTVRTNNGVRTVDTQLGTVTSVSSMSLTVHSVDGFSLTWTLASNTVVRDAGARSSASALAVGQTVRVLGPAATSSGGSPIARLIRVRPATRGGSTGSGRGGQPSAAPSSSSTT